MEDKVELTPMIKVLAQLRKEGYLVDFRVENEEKLCTMDDKQSFTPNEVQIVNFYRFEGESNPDDMSILYVLETTSGAKGTISDAYGPYSDSIVEGFMKKVKDLGKNLDKRTK
ncbi:hypothetical protein ACFSRY_05495 [Pontibacter locisalis]|uniref:Phosphoribosylpyrophosphate synthetase n=1 Tax=Pontibacter locisalis TaxID=1719035 RepID=A0ABW5IJZ9_9BACT